MQAGGRGGRDDYRNEGRRDDRRDGGDDRRKSRGDGDRPRDDRGGRNDDRNEDERRNERHRRDAPEEPPVDKKRKSKWGPDEPTPATTDIQHAPSASMLQMMNMSMGTKTEMCMAFTEGLCTKGDMCVYAHSL